MGISLSSRLVYLSILIIAVCGIIYELIIGAVSSYLWGDSIYYFSITIGLYMSAMGLGAFLSRFAQDKLFDWFVASEIAIAFWGGISATFLFWSYAETEWYEYALVFITVLIGALVGIEIPLLIRLLESQEDLRENVANVLTYDYIGGLVGALLFPLLLLPYLGLVRAALVLGLLNIGVAVVNFIRHRQLLYYFKPLLGVTLCIGCGLSYGLWKAPVMELALEQRLYRDKVILSLNTAYQHLTVTRWHEDIRLFINGGLQFSSLDEHRYHESLVHPAMALNPHARSVLILGGGDGLAIRELLKYPALAQIHLVDIDPAMTQIFQETPVLSRLNQQSLNHEKVKIIHEDAYKFVEQDTHFYDVIVVDLPDPSQTALAKLYSRGFYQMLQKRLRLGGSIVVQSTSPFFAPEAFWCIHETLAQTGLAVYPYQVDIPSFGNWGFQLATQRQFPQQGLQLPEAIQHKVRFLNTETLNAIFAIPEDLKYDLDKIDINTLTQPVIINYYERGWNGIR